MPVNLTTANKALKEFYLSVVADQINLHTNPFYARVKQSENYVSGNRVVKLCRVGLNGGIGAGSETGNLPTSAGNNYVQFSTELKNLYGQITISDKAIQASANSSGAFVNLLTDEMESLLSAAKYNFSRMLYGTGEGVLTTTKANSNTTTLLVDDTTGLVEGLVIDLLSSSGTPLTNGLARTIASVDRVAHSITLTGAAVTTTPSSQITVQGSLFNEITGLGAIFSSVGSLYGQPIGGWLKPHSQSAVGAISDLKIQTAIDTVEGRSGSNVDFITCSYGVRRAYVQELAQKSRNLDVVKLDGGFTAISYAGIPVYADRFCPAGTMFLLDTSAFTLHQLCDWRWIENSNGQVLHQVSGTPYYTATLVKYAELMCDRPNAQAKLSGISEA